MPNHATTLRRFMVEAMPVLAGLYGVLFLSSIGDYFCDHSMFRSLFPSCLELSLASGFLAATVVGLGSAKPDSTLEVFVALALFCTVLLGIVTAGRIGFPAHAVLMAMFTYLPISLGVIGGAFVIVAARRVNGAKRPMTAGLLVAVTALLATVVVWREAGDNFVMPDWVKWLVLLIFASVYGFFVRRKFSIDPPASPNAS